MNSTVEKIASISFETNGYNLNSANKAEGYQILSAGIIISDCDTFIPVEKLYIELSPNDGIIWDKKLEKYHGFTLDYLKEHGVSEELAVTYISDLLFRHIGTEPVVLLGHNVSNFTYWFLRDIFNKYDIELILSARVLDTFTLGKTFFDFNTQQDMFKFMKLGSKPTAMDKSQAYLKFFRVCKKYWNSI